MTVTTEHLERAKTLIREVEMLPSAQRAGELVNMCRNDPTMRGDLEVLLTHPDTPLWLRDLEEDIRRDLEPALGASSEVAIGSRIGSYRIIRKLGEGGMGEVYLAEQETPFTRSVALKVIKLGMDTKEVLARFDSERQALARMSHPNVATIHDAGVTERGRPFFVMEYVPGIPITDYCNRHRLTIRERLELFACVCGAIHHAHRKGIIHRDIKPSNVLVAEQDDQPVPKVIDFGVARATQRHLIERTLYTEHGQLIGTPAYMSPEQANPIGAELDERTDVYSLGVLLYELFVGARPFDDAALRQVPFTEFQHIIREVDPSKPSARLSTLGRDCSAIAQERATEPRALARQLRGDLDWIVMKCLDKDRRHRYETVNALANDVRRFLRNEDIEPGPTSTAGRMRQFVQCNKALIASIGVSLVALSISIVVLMTAQGRATTRTAVGGTQTSKQSPSMTDHIRPLRRERLDPLPVTEASGQLVLESSTWMDLGPNLRPDGNRFGTEGSTYFATDGKDLYLLEGNTSNLYILDSTVWRFKARAPIPKTMRGWGFQYGGGWFYATVSTNSFNFADGTGLASHLYAYDPVQDRWERRADANVNRHGIGIEALAYDHDKGLLYATIRSVKLENYGGDETLKRKLAIYKPESNEWIGATSEAMVEEWFDYHTQTEYLDGKIYVFPGRRYGRSEGESFLEVYDIKTEMWTRTPTLAGSRTGPAFAPGYAEPHVHLTADSARKWLFLMGSVSNKHLYVYAPESKTWSHGPTAPYDGGHGSSLEYVADQGTLFLIDGENAEETLQGMAMLDTSKP